VLHQVYVGLSFLLFPSHFPHFSSLPLRSALFARVI
jgi:hypothetical protein